MGKVKRREADKAHFEIAEALIGDLYDWLMARGVNPHITMDGGDRGKGKWLIHWAWPEAFKADVFLRFDSLDEMDLTIRNDFEFMARTR
jgi:hypothetical protein